MSPDHLSAATRIGRRTLLAGTAGALGAGLLCRATPAEALTGGVAFDANYPVDHFSRYLLTYPAGVTEGVDYGIVDDPAGSGRKVAFFSNHRGLTHGNTIPRSTAESPRFIRPLGAGVTNDVYVHYVSFYLPTPPPQYGPSDGLTLVTPAYGPPFGGASPLTMTVFPVGGAKVRVLLGPTPYLLGPDFTLPVNTWHRVALQFKFAYDGWVRMWMGTGLTSTSWQPVPLHGDTVHRMAVMAPGVNDGVGRDPRTQPNSSRIGAYGRPARVYYGHHGITQELRGLPEVG